MKKIVIILLVVLTGISIWYFLLKNEDYRVYFEIESPKGAVYEQILNWNYERPFSEKIINTISKKPYYSAVQNFRFSQDSLLNIVWQLQRKNNEITKITASFTDKYHSINQRLELLIGKSTIKPQSINFSKKLKAYIEKQNQSFRISDIDTTVFKKRKFLYKKLKSTTESKAKTMLIQNGVIMNYIIQNQLTLDDYPFVEVLSWDKNTDSITFNFCYPIKETLSNKNQSILYAEKDNFDALQILYNGNYNKSHVAWYAYEDYLENNDQNRKVLPIEVYQNDPQLGGNEMEWETKVLLPL